MWYFSDEGGFQWSILCVAWVMFWEQKGIKRRILEHLRETIKEKTIIYKVFLEKFSFFWITFIFSFVSFYSWIWARFFLSKCIQTLLVLGVLWEREEWKLYFIEILHFYDSQAIKQANIPVQFTYHSVWLIYATRFDHMWFLVSNWSKCCRKWWRQRVVFFKILILVVFLLWIALTRYNRRRWGGSGWIDDLKYSAKKDGLTFAKWKYFW